MTIQTYKHQINQICSHSPIYKPQKSNYFNLKTSNNTLLNKIIGCENETSINHLIDLIIKTKTKGTENSLFKFFVPYSRSEVYLLAIFYERQNNNLPTCTDELNSFLIGLNKEFADYKVEGILASQYLQEFANQQTDKSSSWLSDEEYNLKTMRQQLTRTRKSRNSSSDRLNSNQNTPQTPHGDRGSLSLTPSRVAGDNSIVQKRSCAVSIKTCEGNVKKLKNNEQHRNSEDEIKYFASQKDLYDKLNKLINRTLNIDLSRINKTLKQIDDDDELKYFMNQDKLYDKLKQLIINSKNNPQDIEVNKINKILRQIKKRKEPENLNSELWIINTVNQPQLANIHENTSFNDINTQLEESKRNAENEYFNEPENKTLYNKLRNFVIETMDMDIKKIFKQVNEHKALKYFISETELYNQLKKLISHSKYINTSEVNQIIRELNENTQLEYFYNQQKLYDELELLIGKLNETKKDMLSSCAGNILIRIHKILKQISNNIRDIDARILFKFGKLLNKNHYLLSPTDIIDQNLGDFLEKLNQKITECNICDIDESDSESEETDIEFEAFTRQFISVPIVEDIKHEKSATRVTRNSAEKNVKKDILLSEQAHQIYSKLSEALIKLDNQIDECARKNMSSHEEHKKRFIRRSHIAIHIEKINNLFDNLYKQNDKQLIEKSHSQLIELISQLNNFSEQDYKKHERSYIDQYWIYVEIRKHKEQISRRANIVSDWW